MIIVQTYLHGFTSHFELITGSFLQYGLSTMSCSQTLLARSSTTLRTLDGILRKHRQLNLSGRRSSPRKRDPDSEVCKSMGWKLPTSLPAASCHSNFRRELEFAAFSNPESSQYTLRKAPNPGRTSRTFSRSCLIGSQSR